MGCDSKANKPEKAVENFETAISTEVRIPIPDSITTFLLDAATTDFHMTKVRKSHFPC